MGSAHWAAGSCIGAYTLGMGNRAPEESIDVQRSLSCACSVVQAQSIGKAGRPTVYCRTAFVSIIYCTHVLHGMPTTTGQVCALRRMPRNWKVPEDRFRPSFPFGTSRWGWLPSVGQRQAHQSQSWWSSTCMNVDWSLDEACKDQSNSWLKKFHQTIDPIQLRINCKTVLIFSKSLVEVVGRISNFLSIYIKHYIALIHCSALRLLVLKSYLQTCNLYTCTSLNVHGQYVLSVRIFRRVTRIKRHRPSFLFGGALCLFRHCLHLLFEN